MCAGLGTTFFLGISTAATQRNLSTVVGGQVRTGENSGRVRGGGAECAAGAGIFSRWAAGWISHPRPHRTTVIRFFIPSRHGDGFYINGRVGQITRPSYEGLSAHLMMFET
jgi:hypothetical protein